MSGDQRSRYDPAASSRYQLDAALELVSNLQSKLEVLDNGSDETRRVSRELQLMIDEIRQALADAR
jgi:hypothetical protein